MRDREKKRDGIFRASDVRPFGKCGPMSVTCKSAPCPLEESEQKMGQKTRSVPLMEVPPHRNM